MKTSVFLRMVAVAAGAWLLVLATSGGERVKASNTVDFVPVPQVTDEDTVDLTRLPIGDGKISSEPKAGYLWSCQQNYPVNAPGGRIGDWYNAQTGTFDLTKKPVVDGANTWQYSLTVAIEGNMRVLRSNGMPNHPTGNYPIAATDDAAQYDRNPNRISAQNNVYRLPADPVVAEGSSCAGGQVGVMLTGSPIFNAVDAGGRDAVAHELQDACYGHPEMRGQYHYHNLTNCIDDAGTGHSKLLGYAFDGFGIYGTRGEDGAELTSGVGRLPRPRSCHRMGRPVGRHVPLPRDGRVPVHGRLLPRYRGSAWPLTLRRLLATEP
jgi:hypothetical protein